ncbi:MAG TPA: GNAT family N-acetyltransferase [Paraburkholderia sp.]|jgi:GNAT superfamily N-acetyltransferase|uniref:GNAT family N-acetyltransferase n=1 Tax=Paraburkholderia sp. TaxID=1926495 RepID=UPI002B486A60|nr:GNAT family N-acetyltransferase [Paraburkholderia sp.]HKR41343.1 GNAT family N-acetyltransferase [Paraburkholderia sp.]
MIATEEHDEWLSLDPSEMVRLQIRRFDIHRDSSELIAKLLRSAASRLDRKEEIGSYYASRESGRRRSAKAEACFIAACRGQLVGTLTIEGTNLSSPCRHYRRQDVATIHRYGVDPRWQHLGIGRALLSFANRWAAALGYAQLALDTPVAAGSLLDFYHTLGFRLVDTVHFPGCADDSAVLSRPTLIGWRHAHASHTNRRLQHDR